MMLLLVWKEFANKQKKKGGEWEERILGIQERIFQAEAVEQDKWQEKAKLRTKRENQSHVSCVMAA